MTEFTALLQQGNTWLFAPTAILLGALHGMEPGHSKTMMAAFIVAVRGTLLQAALLGLSATLSHTAVVWAVAMAGLTFGKQWASETTEPYFQIASAALIVAVALWMLWRTRRQQHGAVAHEQAEARHHEHGHAHTYNHEHNHEQDAHARAHAQDIERRFNNRRVTTGQIVLFGLTGGLIPCPAAITVLLLCLQLKQITLGAALVLCFSVGLALTLVASGMLAALGAKHASRRWPGLGALAHKAPYVSGALIVMLGLYVGYEGLQGLHALP